MPEEHFKPAACRSCFTMGPIMRHSHICHEDPHLSRPNLTNVIGAVTRRTAPCQWFYGNSCTPMQIGPNTAFAAGREQILRFDNSQQQTLEKLGENYRDSIHGGCCKNGSMHSKALAVDLVKDGLRTSIPFLAPARLHNNYEPNFTMIDQQQIGKEVGNFPGRIPSFPLNLSRDMVSSAVSCTRSSTGQLTIFYKGQVNVYNNVSSAKVQDLMHLAATDDALPHYPGLITEKSASLACRPLNVNAGNAKTPSNIINLNSSEPPADQLQWSAPTENSRMNVQGDQEDSSIAKRGDDFMEEEPVVPRYLPQARKASLARFIQRRKERLMERSPYCPTKQLI